MVIVVGCLLGLLVVGYIIYPLIVQKDSARQREHIGEELEQEILALRKSLENLSDT